MVREIPLTGGRTALVDDEDAAIVLAHAPWHVVRGGNGGTYVSSWSGGDRIKLHRLIMRANKDQWVDHRNGDPLDCRRANLRIATPTQNAHNRRRKANGSSRFKGVKWVPERSRWRATITKDGRRQHLGTFSDEVDAAMAYDKAAREIHGEFCRLNFPAPGEQPA